MTHEYFNKLNYTLANEDTSMEVGMMPEGLEHAVTVAGSGGRAMPLLAKAPRKLTCLDLSNEQLYLTELRIEALRALSHAEYLRFWGYPPKPAEPGERRALYGRVAPRLGKDADAFLRALFESVAWESVLYLGKWEKTFAKLSTVVRAATGLKGTGMFSALTRGEHERYMAEKFPARAWRLAVTMLGNANVFNALLYKGHFPKRNVPGSAFAFYDAVFKRIFRLGPARENFLLQMLFFGKIIFAEGCTAEADPKIYADAKRGLEGCEVRYVQGNAVERIAEIGKAAPSTVGFVSLSDVPSYFSGETETGYVQRISPALAPGALVVVRNYLRVPEGTDLAGFENVASRYQELIDRESVQMYLVDVFEKARS